MASWNTESIESSDKNLKFAVYEGAKLLSSHGVLKRLKISELFRSWYSNILTDTGFDAFFWENRPFTSSSLSKPYECNVICSSYLAGKSPDREPFRNYFDDKNDVVCFANLGKDAYLIAPVPKSNDDGFTHLGRFLREADRNQIDSFWKTSAHETLKRISKNPVWLSTSGLGVFWLHARIDSTPKYYQTEAYRTLF